MFYQVIGFYAKSGTNFESNYSLARPENFPVIASIGIISSLLSCLDGYDEKSAGKLYSIPKVFQTSCDYTRPYHFWMAAFLAHALKEKGYPDGDIVRVVHGQELYYEEDSDAGTKKPMKDVIQLPAHSSYLVETEKNVAFSDAGALFGAASTGGISAVPANLSIDSDIGNMYVKSEGKYIPSEVLKLFDDTTGILLNLATDAQSSMEKKKAQAKGMGMSNVQIPLNVLLGGINFNNTFKWESLIDPQDSFDWAMAALKSDR